MRIAKRSDRHARAYSDHGHQALLYLRHNTLGKYKLGIVSAADVRVAMNELPRVLGNVYKAEIEPPESDQKCGCVFCALGASREQKVLVLFTHCGEKSMSFAFKGDHMAITGIVPQLRTTDMTSSVRFYTEKLGFSVEFNYRDFYTGIRAGGQIFHLKLVDRRTLPSRMSTRANTSTSTSRPRAYRTSPPSSGQKASSW